MAVWSSQRHFNLTWATCLSSLHPDEEEGGEEDVRVTLNKCLVLGTNE